MLFLKFLLALLCNVVRDSDFRFSWRKPFFMMIRPVQAMGFSDSNPPPLFLCRIIQVWTLYSCYILRSDYLLSYSYFQLGFLLLSQNLWCSHTKQDQVFSFLRCPKKSFRYSSWEWKGDGLNSLYISFPENILGLTMFQADEKKAILYTLRLQL